ncbi:hypothetical protein [Mycolicibacterium sp. P1-18]|uniref:hypothetical protein n=1 Tax=Mycolicibacterium sp. P1-18 TaxID=2024615 RepID=UPI0011F182B3|nr:hypothetical protein [Mycolicibacterium sp. P1-18]
MADSISPQDARRQVVDASRQVVADLGAEVATAKFGYDSCNDRGDAPFRGHGNLLLWMPGADRTREVPADTVLDLLRQRGWQTDPHFTSHGTTFQRGGVDVSVWVIPPPKPDSPPVGHVIVDVFGECRDAFDHRTDHTDRLSEDIREVVSSG